MRTRHLLGLAPAILGCTVLLHVAQSTWAAEVATPERRPLHQQQAERDRQSDAELASRFEAEPVNRAWSQAILRDLQKSLDVLKDLGMTGSEVECRSRTCRLKVTGPDRPSIDAALQELGFDLIDLLPNMRIAGASKLADSVAVMVYLEKPEQEVGGGPAQSSQALPAP